ncbi:hyalin-like isoform X2 [Apostichopus japonicus]|uniref:hyalin-like isoform X2 n=1 Tax=Stichopus japonicus TaxID=307972 RepID=UPI003AB6EA49
MRYVDVFALVIWDSLVRCLLLFKGVPFANSQVAVLRCPPDISVFAPNHQSYADVTWEEPAAPSDSWTISYRSHTPGPIPIGTYRVSYEYVNVDSMDDIGCSFEIIVVVPDTEPPVVTNCPSSFDQEIEEGVSELPITWLEPTAEDKSGTVFVEQSHRPGESIYIGRYVRRINVEYTFKDPSENKAFCTFIITLIAVDRIPPTINCPLPVMAEVSPSMVETYVYFDQPTAEDNSGQLRLSVIPEIPDAFPIGSTTLEYLFTDLTGNAASCAVTVTVLQHTVPPTVIFCPTSGITWFTDQGTPSTKAYWKEPYAIDESTVELKFQTHQPGDEFKLGNTTVMYIFHDSASNPATCQFNVSVEELPSVQQDSRVSVVVVVCLVVLIIHTIVTVTVTMYCIRRNRGQPTTNPTSNPTTVVAVSAPQLPIGDYESIRQSAGRISNESAAGGSAQVPQDAEYMELGEADGYVKPSPI